MIFELLIVFPLFYDWGFGNGRIDHFADLLKRHTNIDKLCDEVGQKFKFLCKLIGCEAQEGVL